MPEEGDRTTWECEGSEGCECHEAESKEARDGTEALRDALAHLAIEAVGSTSGRHPVLLKTFDVQGIADHVNEHDCKNVIVMLGAGVSVNAGIPDFRTPGSGLYDNLSGYDLPSPQAVFELDFFRKNPKPFYQLAKELMPGKRLPTIAHYFVRLLHEEGRLLRCFSQNIDSLERVAGLPSDKLVAAHGNFDEAHCIDCGHELDIEEIRDAIESGQPHTCSKCGGYVKPKIVFFGEMLPVRFFKLLQTDFPKCDLLIVMGTSLAVQPFAALVREVPKHTPRLLINRELVGEEDPMLVQYGYDRGGFNFGEGNYRDAYFLGDCDEGVMELSRHLGIMDKLEVLYGEKGQDDSLVRAVQVAVEDSVQYAQDKSVASDREEHLASGPKGRETDSDPDA